jgi:fatty acid desaturase
MLPEPVLDFILMAMPVIPFLYLVLQVGAILKMRGGLRVAAFLCGLVMLGLVLFVAWASGVMGSNIAPIYIVFALPVLTAILILLWLIHALRPAPPDTRYL